MDLSVGLLHTCALRWSSGCTNTMTLLRMMMIMDPPTQTWTTTSSHVRAHGSCQHGFQVGHGAPRLSSWARTSVSTTPRFKLAMHWEGQMDLMVFQITLVHLTTLLWSRSRWPVTGRWLAGWQRNRDCMGGARAALKLREGARAIMIIKLPQTVAATGCRPGPTAPAPSGRRRPHPGRSVTVAPVLTGRVSDDWS